MRISITVGSLFKSRGAVRRQAIRICLLALAASGALALAGCAASTGTSGVSSSSVPATQTAVPVETAPTVEEPAPLTVQEVVTEAFGTFKPLVAKGKGDSVVKVPAGAAAAIVTATHSGTSNFTLQVLDSENHETELLINTIGKYTGTTFAGESDAPGRLKVGADGAWTITVAPVASAKLMGTSAAGRGDAVLLYDGPVADWTVSHKGQSNFVVKTISTESSDLPINEIGNYSGVVPVGAGPMVVIINADGAWSVQTQ